MSESLFKGVELVNAKGETIQGDVAVRGKNVVLYFAADWCPDCRNLQPSLNDFYARVNAETPQLELVFVGSDRTEEDQRAHFQDKQGPWWAVPFASEFRSELKRRYRVCVRREQEAVGVTDIKAGIPTLVLVQQNGELIRLFNDKELETDGLQPLEDLLVKV
uniref:Thioredoxin domain-containing protein n=1 Tax=Globisporangium ultimum (strain ATCC 200006 / CBS 805.95 / DAOM BR144) TaxID=431595 RepID=K3WAK8_GLOUD